MQSSAAFILNGLQSCLRLEGRARKNNRRASCRTKQRTEDHREAVIHWHWYAKTVILGKPENIRRQRRIVNHVVMRQRRRLRCASRAAGELDVDRRIKVGALSNGVQR